VATTIIIGCLGQQCSCDISAATASQLGRRLTPLNDEVVRRKVEFSPAEVKGNDFKRPFGASRSFKFFNCKLFVQPSDIFEFFFHYLSRTISVDPAPTMDPLCDSEQIHINLGNTDSSVMVSYASFLETTPSIVYYSTDKTAVLNQIEGVGQTTGSVMSYSELIFIDDYLYEPVMGDPTVNSSVVVTKENTANWAVDPSNGNHYANYKKVTSAQTGIGAYNNPYM